MSIKKGIIKEVANEIESLGGLMYEIESYKLQPYWKMSEEQESKYKFGLKAPVGELEDYFKNNQKKTKKMYEYILKGVIASGDIEKFKYVIRLTPGKYVKKILSTIIEVSHGKGVNEELALEMIKITLEGASKEGEILKKIISGGEAGSAASYEYYKVAKYLLGFEKQKKPLNGYNLYDMEDNSKNYFAGFKWMIEQGIGYEKSMIGKILCQDKLYNMNKIEVFKDKEKVLEATEFLKSIGLVDEEKVAYIISKCEMIARAVQPYSFKKPYGVDKGYFQKIIANEPIGEVELLLDHLSLQENLRESNTIFNAIYFVREVERAEILMDYLIKSSREFSGQNIGYKLVNHTESNIIRSVIDKMKEAEVPIKRMYDEDYEKYTIYKMEKNMESCESNKLIAEYMGIEDQINWDACLNTHDEL